MYGYDSAERLPFGKYQGRTLEAVPKSYLRWMLSSCDRLDGWLRSRVKDELARRGERFAPAEQVLADVEELVTMLVSDDLTLPHNVAGVVTDHLLDAFERVRQQYGIVSETELVIAPTVRRADEREGCAWPADGAGGCPK